MENTQPHSHETDIDIMQPLSPEMKNRLDVCYKKLIDNMPEDPMRRLIPKNLDAYVPHDYLWGGNW